MDTATAAPVTAPPTWTLTAHDRCDACGQRAYIRATLHAGGELLFCAHHGREHMLAISPSISNWLDETGQLDQKV